MLLDVPAETSTCTMIESIYTIEIDRLDGFTHYTTRMLRNSAISIYRR